MNAKILLVDDDRNMLVAWERNLRLKFKIETAEDAMAALAKIEASGPYAVVVSDREMPGMDGLQLLNKVRERWPDTMRMMVTGHPDLDLVIRLVNENNIFRFLTKPCPTNLMIKALEDAQRYYQLAVAEKELLNNTLNGSIKLLTDLLSMVESPFSGQSQSLRVAITSAAQHLGLENPWEIHLAAMLAPIGKVTVPQETLSRLRTGQPLSKAEEQMVAQLPETAARLLENIPRLEGVARIVRYQNKSFDGSGYPADSVAGEGIPAGARLLKIILDFMDLRRGGAARAEAMESMSQRKGIYDPALLALWKQTFECKPSWRVQAASLSKPVSVKDLARGMVLRSNIETKEGALILPAGQEINDASLEKILNFERVVGVKAPILIERVEAPD